MNFGNWNEIKEQLEVENKKIFNSYNVNQLSDYEKRRIIFEYLCNNLNYDYQELSNLMNSIITDPLKGIKKVMDNYKGVCNNISQYYKLLLDINGIYSVCVICDNMMEREHQINLVYDKENDIYSFDDITSVLVNMGTINECFDYDLDMAKNLNQGKRPVGYLRSVKNKDNKISDMLDTFGIILATPAIYMFVGREDTNYLEYGLEVNNNISLPKNIRKCSSEVNIR